MFYFCKSRYAACIYPSCCTKIAGAFLPFKHVSSPALQEKRRPGGNFPPGALPAFNG